MNLIVYPGAPLRGEVRIPGDKSISHRAALFAALAEGESCIENFLDSGVTRVMLNALTALGVTWQFENACLRVRSPGLKHWQIPVEPLFCGNSATTLRLLAGALAAAGIPAVLDGTPGLRRRPMERIVEPLRLMGVPITAAEGGGAPLTLQARPADRLLRGMRHTLTVASAQVKTCLLLAGLAADAPVEVVEPTLSRDHTERMLRGMGVALEEARLPDGTARVRLYPPQQPLPPLRGVIPGDFSAAAFLLVAASILPGSDVLIRGVGLNPTRIGLLETLWEMGARIQVTNRREVFGEPVGDVRVQASALRAGQVRGERVVAMIDEFPAFAAAALHAEGVSTVREAQELRYKESDRIAALVQEVRRLGGVAEEYPDGFNLTAGSALGGTAHPHGDHRLAMALAVAGLAGSCPVTIEQAEIIGESFPDFVLTLQSLGAHVEVIP